MSNDNFLIESSDIELAKDVCNSIDDPKIRNRAVANVLAAGVSKKYFTDIEVDTDSGLHNVPFVLNKLDISDIYINDSYIDVRVYFNDDELCVPKSHFDRDLLPVAYMFVKLDSELSGGVVTGFLPASSVDTKNDINGYYKVSENDLVSYYDIEGQLVSAYFDDEPNDFDNQIFDYLDGRLEDENEFYKVLLKSRYCRNQLKNAANVQSIMRGIAGIDLSSKQDLLQDMESDSLEELQFDESIKSDELDFDVSSDSLLEPVENDDAVTLSFEPTQESLVDTIEEVSENNLLIVENDSDLDSFDENLNTELEPVQEEVFAENTIDVEIPEEVAPIIDMENSVVDESVEIDNIEPVQEEPEALINEELIPDSVHDEVSVDVKEEYLTNVTPSLESVEEVVAVDDLEKMLDNDKSVFDEVSEQPQVQGENAQQIDDLFEPEIETEYAINQTITSSNKKSGLGVFFILALAIVGALGYFGYTKFANQESTLPEQTDPTNVVAKQNDNNQLPVQDAMPIETVENVPMQNSSEEAVSTTIPAIEQNLDASILVSNLSVNWEVPAGYVTNNTAKRYFTKVGKIIQLNLKADMLLLSKPPITNKIMVELEYNKDTSKFAVKGITASSGEKAVDDLVVKVVNNALDINLKTNMNTFVNIAGNPVLIIRL